MELHVTKYIEAKKLLKTKGSKVALQTSFDGPYIYAEKKDFLETLENRRDAQYFTDYDGNVKECLFVNNVLHIQAGVI